MQRVYVYICAKIYGGTSQRWFVLARQKGVKCWQPGNQVVGQSRVKVDSALVAECVILVKAPPCSRLDLKRSQMISNVKFQMVSMHLMLQNLESVWGFHSLSSCFNTSGTKDKNGHWKGSIQPGGVYVHRLSNSACCVGRINKEWRKGADVWWEHNAFLGIPISSIWGS